MLASLLSCIPGIDNDEAAAVEHYVIGYMAFWHIAFVDEDCLVPCNDDALRRPFPASTSSCSVSR